MKKLSAFAIVALAIAAATAHAQPSGDASSTRQPIMDSKPQLRAERQKDARPAGKVKAIGGDELKTEQDDSIGNDKASASGQRRVASRESRYPNRPPVQQGGTPDLPGAK